MKASTDFAVALGTLASGAGDVNILGALSMDYSLAAMSTLTASVMQTDASDRKLSTSTSNGFTPGSTVSIRVEYTGFNPDEDQVLIYSLVAPSGQEYRIMSKEMRSHASGSGRFDAHWQAPWDSRFAGVGPARIQVRCSNLLSRTVSTAPFNMNHYTDGQSIFSSAPRAGQNMPCDMPVPVRWNKDLLAYFKGRKDSTIRGDRNQADHVYFVLHGEKLAADGSVSKAMSHRMLFDRPVQNTGHATMVFPSEKARGFDRFYLTVHHAEADTVSGWNDGYFSLDSGSGSGSAVLLAASRALSVVAPATEVKEIATADQRELNVCGANKILLTLTAKYSGGISNVKVKLLGNLPSWTGDWPVANLMSPYSLCFSPPAPKSSGGSITSIANPSCTVSGVGAGKCQDSAWSCVGGQYYSGACPGANNIKCCVVRPSSSTTKASASPACNVPTAGAGTCIATSQCTNGYYYSGYCAGASNIKCCVPSRRLRGEAVEDA